MFFSEMFRHIFAVVESLAVFVTVLFSTGQTVMPGDYLEQLNRITIYENRAQTALPQTAARSLVMRHFSAPRTDGKTPKCLLIGFDGARADALTNAVSGESGVSALLSGGGAAYHMYAGGDRLNKQKTETSPGWTTLLTGHWAKVSGGTGHGVSRNGIRKAVNPKLVFTDLLEQNLAQKTAFAVSWDGHFADGDAAYVNDIAYAAANGLNAGWYTLPDDAGTFAKTQAEIESGADMVMCIFEHCDHAGHDSGFGNQNPAYVQAFRDADRYAFALIQAVRARPTYAAEDWLILITSDHGGIGKSHGGQFSVERQTFLVTNMPCGFND